MGKTKRQRNFGIRTPAVVRFCVLLGYADIARRGVSLLLSAYDGEEAKWVAEARNAIVVYSSVYTFESLYSLYPGWISMHGVDMKHMYEHHFPCMILGIALMMHFRTMDQSRLGDFLKIARLPFAMGLVTQLCELYFVVRTFLKYPDGRISKIIQRILGFVLVSSFSLTVQYAFLGYVRYKSKQAAIQFTLAEIAIVPTALYLALILHPMYIRTHFKRLRALLFEKRS